VKMVHAKIVGGAHSLLYTAVMIRHLKAISRIIVFGVLYLYLLRLPQPHAF
jgi:hypothetical protein